MSSSAIERARSDDKQNASGQSIVPLTKPWNRVRLRNPPRPPTREIVDMSSPSRSGISHHETERHAAAGPGFNSPVPEEEDETFAVGYPWTGSRASSRLALRKGRNKVQGRPPDPLTAGETSESSFLQSETDGDRRRSTSCLKHHQRRTFGSGL